jgi:hypothetical protein
VHAVFTPRALSEKVRDFVAERRAFPWFSLGLAPAFVENFEGAEVGNVVLLTYAFGVLPIAGPLQRTLPATQHAIVEASPVPGLTGAGQIQPRAQWHRVASWLGFREVSFPEDGPFAKRFRVTSSSDHPRDIVHARVRQAMLATTETSLAWSQGRVMVRCPGPLAEAERKAFQEEAVALIAVSCAP